MRLIRTREIQLLWDGDMICALAGGDLQEGVAGFGDTVPEALANLVKTVQADGDTTIWVPRPAKLFREGDVLKAQCPECGHIRVMGEFAEVIAYRCNACGSGVDCGVARLNASRKGADS